MTTSPDKTATYRDRDSALTISSFTYSANLATCGSFSYTLTKTDGTSYDTAIFTFDPATPSIVVSTTSNTQIGTYVLKLLATLGPWGSVSSLITVTIALGCPGTTVTPQTIAT